MLQPEHALQIPALAQQVARAAFPHGSLAMTLRDELGAVLDDRDFANLRLALGQSAPSPARLALVTVLQPARLRACPPELRATLFEQYWIW